jgi:hypothetical protein
LLSQRPNNFTFQEKTMKKLQQLCIAGVFTLVFTTATLAGDIHTGGAPQLPPPNQSSATRPGNTETPGLQNSQAMSDSVADVVLNLLQTMLSAF